MASPQYDTSALALLLTKWKAGDETARDALLTHAQDRIRAAASGRLKMDFLLLKRTSDVWTDDVVQATNLRLCKVVSNGLKWVPESVPQFFALVAEVMRFALLDLARECGGPQWHARGLPDGAGSIEAPDVGVARDVHLLELMERLPAAQRVAFTLRHYEGMGFVQIAEAMGVAVGTAHKLVGGAMEALRAMLEADDGERKS